MKYNELGDVIVQSPKGSAGLRNVCSGEEPVHTRTRGRQMRAVSAASAPPLLKFVGYHVLGGARCWPGGAEASLGSFSGPWGESTLIVSETPSELERERNGPPASDVDGNP